MTERVALVVTGALICIATGGIAAALLRRRRALAIGSLTGLVSAAVAVGVGHFIFNDPGAPAYTSVVSLVFGYVAPLLTSIGLGALGGYLARKAPEIISPALVREVQGRRKSPHPDIRPRPIEFRRVPLTFW